MIQKPFRESIVEFIRANAKPVNKFSHQARLYELARRLAHDHPHDDDILHAAAWLHDLGVFIGHRPEDPAQLASWDCVAYAMKESPALLQRFGFPPEKISAVVDAIRTHQPSAVPVAFEAIVLRDADILEQLGAVGILRTVSKVGQDTRFVLFSDALNALKNNLNQLPAKLKLEQSQVLAEPRIRALETFLAAAEHERDSIRW
jgi:uncharacterized protein